MYDYYYQKLSVLMITLFSVFALNAQIQVTLTVGDTEFGPYEAFPASFGDCVGPDGYGGSPEIAMDISGEATTTLACDSIPAMSLDGKVAIIDRGTCAFVDKLLNAQKAGAIGVVIVSDDRDPGGIGGTGGEDIVIPSVMISNSDGAELKANLEGSSILVRSVTDFDPTAVVLWGDDPMEGGFAGGLNGWTTVGLSSENMDDELAVWTWGTSFETVFASPAITSPTACDGAAVFNAQVFNSDATGAGPYPNQSGELISPIIDCSTFEKVILSFYQHYIPLNGQAFVSYSIDGGDTWPEQFVVETENVLTANETNLVGTELRRIELNGIAGEANVRIKFTFDGDFYFWTIDDVQLLEQVSINDLSTESEDILTAPIGTFPLSQYDEDNPLIITPGAIINNIGNNDASNATIAASIVYEDLDGSAPETVYEESFSVETLEIDSSVFIVLSDFQPTPRLGNYEINYEITSDSVENSTNNNSASATFSFTDRAFSKATWNAAADRPNATLSTTIAGGGEIEFLTGFNVPKGVGFQMDSLVFFVNTSAPSLANLFIEAYVYEWTDTSEDGIFNSDELEVVGFAFNNFDGDETATSTWLRLPLLDFESLEEMKIPFEEDDKNYLIGLRYRGSEIVRFAFDRNIDYTLAPSLNFDRGISQSLGLGFLGINQWIDDIIPDVDNGFTFTDFGSPALSVALLTSEIDSDVETVLAEGSFELELFPNPVSEQLRTTLNLKTPSSYLTYQISDVSGKLLFEHREDSAVQTDQATFDVTRLPQGQYFLKVITEQGFTTKPFVVQ